MRVRFANLDENPNNPFSKAIEEAQGELDRLARAQAEVRAKLVALRQGAPATTKGTPSAAEVDATTPSFPSRPQRRSTSFGSAFAVALTSFLAGGKTRSPASRGTHLRVRMSGSAAFAVNPRLGALIVPARHSCPSTIRSSSVT